MYVTTVLLVVWCVCDYSLTGIVWGYSLTECVMLCCESGQLIRCVKSFSLCVSVCVCVNVCPAGYSLAG